MSLLFKCPTDEALIICGVKDHKGIVRIPISSAELPGIQFSTNRGQPINPQIMEELVDVLSAKPTEINIEQDLTLTMGLNSGDEVTVYLANFSGSYNLEYAEFPRVIDIVKAFPANSNRKELMKAFQYFSGGLVDNLKALSPEDLM